MSSVPAERPSSTESGSEVASGGADGSEAAASTVSECGMRFGFVHATKHNGDRIIYEGDDALFFTTPFAVNTDGAPTSYHPDDPWGNAGLAINTICNGANAYLPDGRRLDYSQCPELVDAFRLARDAGWHGNGIPRMEFYGVATSDAEHSVPCLIPDGPYAGYFVSTTSQVADGSRGRCEQARYLNALELPFIIYPGSRAFTDRGFGKRDIAVLHNPETDVFEYAIVGDRGPSWGLGEGSVFLSKSLRGIAQNPTSRRDVYAFGVPKAHALVLTGHGIDPPYTLEKIRAEAAAALRDWGGIERFKTCVSEFGNRATP